VDPVPDPLLLRKSGSAGDRTRDLCICSQRLWPLDHRGGQAVIIVSIITMYWRYAMVQLVAALHYKPEGRGFDSRWNHLDLWLNPSGRTMVLGSTQLLKEMSTRNISWEVKAVGAYGWQPWNLHVPNVYKILGGSNSFSPKVLSRPVMG
jgi:hypothetical protein